MTDPFTKMWFLYSASFLLMPKMGGGCGCICTLVQTDNKMILGPLRGKGLEAVPCECEDFLFFYFIFIITFCGLRGIPRIRGDVPCL